MAMVVSPGLVNAKSSYTLAACCQAESRDGSGPTQRAGHAPGASPDSHKSAETASASDGPGGDFVPYAAAGVLAAADGQCFRGPSAPRAPARDDWNLHLDLWAVSKDPNRRRRADAGVGYSRPGRCPAHQNQKDRLQEPGIMCLTRRLFAWRCARRPSGSLQSGRLPSDRP